VRYATSKSEPSAVDALFSRASAGDRLFARANHGQVMQVLLLHLLGQLQVQERIADLGLPQYC